MEHNDEHNINYEYITRYIRRTLKGNDGLLRQLEQYAKENDVPIAQPETMRLIEVLLKSTGAKEVLELGAAIGYSAISMAGCGCRVTTIEKDEAMLEALRGNLASAGLEEQVTVRPGDALEVLQAMDGTFDFIFMDAAKAQYQQYLPHCLRMLRPGGILFSDNILYKGRVATDELFIRRKITIIRRLRAYLDHLCSREDLDTAIVPIGDGAAISYKKE